MLTHPTPIFIEQFNLQRLEIESWLHEQFKDICPPFYASVDLRESEFKIAPVDVNLYPAGFNNLSKQDHSKATQALRQAIQYQISSHCKRLLIIAEHHTRNLYYLENIVSLQSLIQELGIEVKVSMLSEEPYTLTTLSGKILSLEVAKKKNDKLVVGDFIPDGIILNADLAGGLPDILVDIQQPIAPSPHLGWYQRLKSYYFKKYEEVCKKFAEDLGWDHWLINSCFSYCDQVDFTVPDKNKDLIEKAEHLLNTIAEKYYLYGVQQKPYLVIKADSGSYGMGVLSIEDIQELEHLSHKRRQHMTKTKGNRRIKRVILQEGVPTITRHKQLTADPVLYLIGSSVVGGFYRVHQTQNNRANLNTPGMELIPMVLHKHTENKTVYAYTVMARLAMLAAAFEAQSLLT
jgi:glutamate--cysteine ligase